VASGDEVVSDVGEGALAVVAVDVVGEGGAEFENK
jgi:hypothetical protein